MKTRAGRKAAALLTLALAPTLVMAWLGLRSIAIEQREAHQTAHARARASGKAIDQYLEDRLVAWKQRLTRELDRLREVSEKGEFELRATTLAVHQVAKSSNSFHIAFSVDEVDALFLPDFEPYTKPEDIPKRSIDSLSGFLRDARDAENNGDSWWARHILLEAHQIASNNRLRAILEHELARLAIRQGELDNAQNHLRELYLSYPEARGINGFPLALTTWPLYADLLDDSSQLDLPPLAPLVTLGQHLATNRWGLSKALRETYWSSIMITLQAMKERHVEDPGTVEQIDAEISGLIKLQNFSSSFESHALPEIRRALEDLAADDEAFAGQPVFVEVPVLGRTHLFLVAALQERTLPAVVGLEIDLEELARSLSLRLPDLSAPYDARVGVFQGDLCLVGDHEARPSNKQGEGRSLVLRGWQAFATPLDPDAPNREAHRQWLIYGILIIFCLLTAIIGGAMAVSSIDRQTMLARMRTRLVRNVSHELRTPVASIRMLGEILQEGGLPRHREQDYFERIARESQRLSTLVEKVLSLSHIEQGKRSLDLHAQMLEPVVQQLVESFQQSEEGRGAKIELQIDSEETIVDLDREALDQVLTNLLSNSVKYGGGHGIKVQLSRQNGKAQLSVRDFGRGIQQHVRDRLFTPFFRERPEDTSATGIGIGLTIVKQLVGLMHGRISLDAQLKGPGTRFIIFLPLSKK